jgi:hypothetical protein
MFIRFSKKLTVALAGLSLLCSASGVPAQGAAPAPPIASVDAPANPNAQGFYVLSSYGPVKTKAEAAATYQKAMESIRGAGGGVLIVPGSTAADWTFINDDQGVVRIPAPPAPATNWAFTPGITVIDTRGGTVKIHPPQITGLQFERTFKAPEGQSSPHWEYHPMLSLENNVVRGSTSYMDYLQEDVAKGKDRRFYVPTIRGLFPGMFINAHGRDGYGGGVQRLWIKSLGYDNEKKMAYFVADTEQDHKKGAIVHNKTHVNVLKMETNAHTELQTFDFMNERHHYSQGDSYLYNAAFHYMGNVHSAAGDENGVLYAAFVYGETDAFKGTVASVDPEKNEVVFAPNTLNAKTLGTGRPLINMNPQKWITGGKVHIVRPASYWQVAADDPSLKDPVFKGKTYPTTIAKNPRTGISGLSMGGLIQSTADAPWSEDVVGRYFAVNVPNETIPDSIINPGNPGRLRWYLITSFKQNPDGTKEIRLERHWWGAKEAGSPTLYQESNYSSDGHLQPLDYIIAPGSNVYDVSRAATDANNQPYGGGVSPRTLLIAPYRDSGTPFDFAPSDPIQQAIGPDPFHPVPFRAWTWDQVPGAFPSPILDIANYGVTRASVLSVAGNNQKGWTPWENVIDVTADVGNVLDVEGKVSGSVIRIGQQDKPAPFTWMYDGGTKAANLAVDQKGTLSFDGNGAKFAGGFTTLGGLSGTSVEAHNLRGVAVAVEKNASSLTVKFPRAEDDANYAVFLETNWLSQRAITERTPQGFTVAFATPAPENAKLDWTLVR